jgi:eukaryotic-like serine/threonine-protein kinase
MIARMSRRIDRSDRPQATTLTSLPPGAETVADRYVLLRELGSGGVGAVYLAQDRQTGESVALKKLSRVDAKSVLRFKREFRSLAHIQHPNLVRLYDLERDPGGLWFLTMEYVPGTDLVSYLRPEDATAPDWHPDSARVFATFRQLARGVNALHGAGMLHRDLKPSNVLVADDRVLVLDFGLVRDLDERDARLTEEGMVSGTPAYMAPEQACAKPLNEAADWYAFGVMLYEVLSGELPFDGPLMQIMRQKIDCDPTPIAELVPGTPPTLSALCTELLRRDPAQRPGAAEILARLGASQPPITRTTEIDTQSLTDARPEAPHFVGRAEPLQRLQSALDEVTSGKTVAVHVRGLSGAGKSALLERFLAEVETHGAGLRGSDVLVLRSRCYEREAMPFKALDSIMDALVLHLARLDDVSVSHLLPADIQALAQLFPVLERVRAVKKLLGLQRVQSHARSHRQRAEVALRELFGRLAQAMPLIVWVDDMHWGDLDSVAILRDWLEQTGGAPFLLLLSYRSDEIETSPALRALLQPSEPGVGRVSEQRLDIGTLAPADMRALCVDRLGTRAHGRNALIDRIVDEARGNPFLASQLASLALAKLERGADGLHALSIDDLVAQMRELLPKEATIVLAVLAVAGRPMQPKLVLRVAGVHHGGRAILHALRNLNLVRTRDAETERLIETYHDRIREHVYGRLSEADLNAIHNGLLRALEHSGRADADWLHSLALGAGDRALALQYGVAAAERAHSSLAFERAAELYTRCLELCADAAQERGTLWRKLGLVLGYSGRGVRAAEALLEAATLCASQSEAFELKRMAASHLVRSGRFEAGDALFEEVMAAASIRAPRSEGKLLAAVAWERCRLGMRGSSFQRRTVAEVSPAVLARIDLLEDLRLATAGHDPLRSVLFATQSLRLALDAGEPTRVVRALATAAVLASTEGSASGNATSRELLARAEKLVNELGTTRERMHLCIARAAANFYEVRFIDVLEPAAEVERALRELAPESDDAAYYLKFTSRSLRLGALSRLDWRRFRREFQEARQEAHATENVHAILLLALNEVSNDEIAGQPELSVARLEAQRSLLPRERFTVLHMLHMTAVMQAACATGKYAWGLEIVAAYWPVFLRSPLRRTMAYRAMAHVAHARLLLNECVRAGTDPSSQSEIRKDLKMLTTVSGAQERQLAARVAYMQGDRTRALDLFARSAELCASRGWEPEILRNQYAIGRVTGGEQGEHMAEAALDALEQRFGCHDARRDVQAHFPELAGLTSA